MKFYEFVEKNKLVKLIDSIKSEEIQLSSYLKIEEDCVIYNSYNIGDIVFVRKYKYKNGLYGSNHIFLIVDIKKIEDNIIYYGMILSSQIQKLNFNSNYYIKKDNQNHLTKNSIIKMDAIYKIFTKNILLKIGNIDKTKVELYKKYFINNVRRKQYENC